MNREHQINKIQREIAAIKSLADLKENLFHLALEKTCDTEKAVSVSDMLFGVINSAAEVILENSCCPDEDVTFTHTVKALGALAGLKE